MKTVKQAKIEKKANTVVGCSVICCAPDKNEDCGRLMIIEGLNCSFCTKYLGGCYLQRKVKITVEQ